MLELSGALAHLRCTHDVFDEMPEPRFKLSPLEAPCPNSIFVKICLGLAVRPRPEPPSIPRADLVAGTSARGEPLDLIFFLKENILTRMIFLLLLLFVII